MRFCYCVMGDPALGHPESRLVLLRVAGGLERLCLTRPSSGRRKAAPRALGRLRLMTPWAAFQSLAHP